MKSDGFSLIESLVATAILSLVVASVFDLVNPMHGTFQAVLETSDEQQRLRVAVNVIGSAIRGAGAGALVGPSRGPLLRVLPPVIPYRIGEINPDAAAGVRYRPDVVSLVSVLRTAAQATLFGAAAQGATFFTVTWPPSCPPPAATICGFAPGTRALVYDGTGRWDAVTVTASSGNTIEFARPGGLSFSYGPGAVVTEAIIRVYSLRVDSLGVPQLYQYDGFQSELPIVDNIVALGFDYFGEPEAPRRLGPVPLDAPVGPWTTYGPHPPQVHIDNPDDAWPTGENCSFQVAGTDHAPRLPDLAAGRALVPLTEEVLTDGPWCLDPTAPGAYDVDLFRIRRIRVRVRAQVPSAALRGPAGALFLRPGQSTSGERFVPDQQIEFDVTPPNMATAR